MTVSDAPRHISRLPVPQSLWLRIVAFLVPGNYGRIELDVIDGRVVQWRIVQSYRVAGEDIVPLRETG